MRSLGGGTNTLGGGPAEPLNSVKQAVNQLIHTMCMGQKTEKDWNEESIDRVSHPKQPTSYHSSKLA